MKTSNLSRRKFLAGVGLATGAAILPKLPLLSTLRGGRAVKAKMAANRALFNKLGSLKPVKALARDPGTCRLPLLTRPL